MSNCVVCGEPTSGWVPNGDPCCLGCHGSGVYALHCALLDQWRSPDIVPGPGEIVLAAVQADLAPRVFAFEPEFA